LGGQGRAVVQETIRTRIAGIIALVSVFVMMPAAAVAKKGNDVGLSKELIALAVSRVTSDDDSAQISEIASILRKRGVPRVSQVGDQASYAFIVATIYPSESGYEHQVWKQILKHQDKYPEDAIRFYRVRMKVLAASERAKRDGITNPELERTIEKMIAEDQAVRTSVTAITKDAGNAMHAVDEGHAAALEQILKTYGVPTFAMVGTSAASDFVVMIQHQPAAMRDEALPLLKANLEKGEADGHDFALMMDRSLNDRGKQQYYGTQVDCIEGKGVLKPVEPIVDLDRRRADVGIIRTTLYLQIANHFCQ
jgi:hypothetical protein